MNQKEKYSLIKYSEHYEKKTSINTCRNSHIHQLRSATRTREAIDIYTTSIDSGHTHTSTTLVDIAIVERTNTIAEASAAGTDTVEEKGIRSRSEKEKHARLAYRGAVEGEQVPLDWPKV